MNRVTALLLCFCIAIPAAFGACPAQPAFDALGLGTVLTGGAVAAITNPSPTYCTRLGTTSTCCDKDAVVAKFQTNSDAIKKKLEDAFGPRDKALLAARKNIRALDTNYTALFVALNSSKTKVEDWAANGDATQKANAAIVKKFYNDYFDFYDKVLTGYEGIYSNFDLYLTQRKTCMDALLKTAANAKCYACGDDSGTDVVVTSNVLGVAPEAAVKTSLVTACYNYVNSSDYQNNIFQLSPYNTSLTDLTNSAVKFANGTSSEMATFISKLTDVKNAAKTYPAGIMPSSCDSTTCNWIVDTLWAQGAVGVTDASITTAIRGGDLYTYINSRRRVLTGSESESHSRNLAFVSSIDSKVTADFNKNPGGVTNDRDPLGSSAFRVGVISSLVALFVAFLF